MKSYDRYWFVAILTLLIVSSGYSQNEENQNTIMDCASSAVVSEVNYQGSENSVSH